MISVDEVERRVPDFRQAARILHEYRASQYHLLTEKFSEFRMRFGEDYQQPAQRAFKVIVICLARVLLRHGRLANQRLPYHDEVHAFDLLSRLQRLYDGVDEDYFSPEERLSLAIFAAAHDLHQGESGHDQWGVGNSERASAEELWRVLELTGYRFEQDAALFELLRTMIYGTTFYTRPFDYRGEHYSGGALAPALVRHLKKRHSDWADDPLLRQQVLLVPVAADIDTANVADEFPVYAERTGRLCRELHGQGNELALGPETADAVYHFLTHEQTRYFFELQCFHSAAAQHCFGAAKHHNGELLRELVGYLQQTFRQDLSGEETEISGAAILEYFMEQAHRLSRDARARGSEP